MIRFVRGNLLDSEAEALVNAVNCVGVMGKGIALEFKKRYPEVFREYALCCQGGGVQRPGDVWGMRAQGKVIIHAFTKDHWRDKSQLEAVSTCAWRLRVVAGAFEVKSLAVPALGCGNGGLSWDDVKPILVKELGNLKADVEIYEP